MQFITDTTTLTNGAIYNKVNPIAIHIKAENFKKQLYFWLFFTSHLSPMKKQELCAWLQTKKLLNRCF